MPRPRRSSARSHRAAPAVQALRGGVRMIPAVELRDVSWGPPKGQDILSDLGFAVPQGQIMAICGANGAGKSSLLRLIYRHHAPRSGVVRVLGQDLPTLPTAKSKDQQYAFVWRLQRLLQNSCL